MRPTLHPLPPAKMPFPAMDENIVNDDFLSDLDKAFEDIQMAPLPSAKKTKAVRRRAKKAEDQYVQMKSTFLDLTRVHLRPVLRYLKAIETGVASKDLCEIVHYVIGPIIGKTRKVGLVEETKALIQFQRKLKAAVKTGARRLSETDRQQLMATFIPVRDKFNLEMRGHSTAVVNLLGFYKILRKNKEVGEPEFKRLFAIGIPSLTMLRKSSIEELVSLSGLNPQKMATLRMEARKFNILSLA